MTGRGFLPAGVKLCPDAAKFLQNAVKALDAGLLASAWFWTERARTELDKATDGPSVEVEGQDGDA